MFLIELYVYKVMYVLNIHLSLQISVRRGGGWMGEWVEEHPRRSKAGDRRDIELVEEGPERGEI